MNNDINKYRVWDRIHRRYDNSFSLDTDGKLWNGNCDAHVAKIERCTGLCDKMGKLIYQEDVLRFLEIYPGKLFAVEWNESEVRFVLREIEGRFPALAPLHSDFQRHCEVVGTIHEEGK